MKKQEKGTPKLTRRVFILICLASLIVLVAAVIVITGDLYRYFSDVRYESLEDKTKLLAQGTETYGISYLKELRPENFNIMLLDSEGSILFDTTDDEIDKEENAAFIKARKEGLGDSMKVLPSLTETNVYSARRLKDGSVILISEKQDTFFSPILGFIIRVVIIAAAGAVLSLHLARFFTARIVKPVNGIDLNDLSDVRIYPELMPLIEKINAQQTEIRHKEQQLRNKQAEFETATDSMREGLVLINTEGSIISINKAAARILGINRSDAENAALSGLGSFGTLIASARAGNSAETVISMGDTNYQINESPVVSEDQVMGAVLFIFSITERENAEMMRREFTSNVSHELKTPLQSISGYAELIMNGMAKSADVPMFAEKIYTEAKRVKNLVDDIMKLSKLDDGAIDMQRADVDLLAAAKTEISLLTQAADEQNVDITVTGDSAVINTFPLLVGAILHNLIENAIKYNHKNGSVNVNVSDSPDAAVLTVSDTGIGVPLEHLDRIFERFYRVDKSHSKQVGGTGLGLAIVKHAAKLQNAAVNIDSVPDKGTTVTVRFPK